MWYKVTNLGKELWGKGWKPGEDMGKRYGDTKIKKKEERWRGLRCMEQGSASGREHLDWATV